LIFEGKTSKRSRRKEGVSSQPENKVTRGGKFWRKKKRKELQLFALSSGKGPWGEEQDNRRKARNKNAAYGKPSFYEKRAMTIDKKVNVHKIDQGAAREKKYCDLGPQQ